MKFETRISIVQECIFYVQEDTSRQVDFGIKAISFEHCF